MGFGIIQTYIRSFLGTPRYSSDDDIIQFEQGFSLVEITVALGVASILALVVATMIQNQNSQILSLRIVASRDNLKNLADRYIGLTSGLITSTDGTQFSYANSQGNQLLSVCLSGNGSSVTSCPAGSTGSFPNCCVAQIITDFNLIDAGDPAKTNKKRFAGTAADPQYYDINGTPCTTPSRTCILQLISSFVATCANGNTCQQAQSLSTSYKLGLISSQNSPVGPVLRTIDSSLINAAACTWTSNGGSLVETCGNVGVGTISPQAKLDVAGTIRVGAETSGATCAVEGAIGYDYAAHSLTVCKPAQKYQCPSLCSGNCSTWYTGPMCTGQIQNSPTCGGDSCGGGNCWIYSCTPVSNSLTWQ